jgi:geranylgeranyl pyrophosphate synthase
LAINNIQLHIKKNLLVDENDFGILSSTSKFQRKCNQELINTSSFNFNLDSKLIRPQILIAFGLLIQESRGKLDEKFFESEQFIHIYNWASVCEMIHNSSLFHVLLIAG